MSLVVFDSKEECIKTEFDDFTFLVAMIKIFEHKNDEEATKVVHELPTIMMTDEWLKEEGLILRLPYGVKQRLLKVGDKSWTVCGLTSYEMSQLTKRLNMLMR